jgi:hypothetical protein
VVEELPKLVMYQGSIGEKEQQTGDGCSGGKLRNTPHLIVCWIMARTVGGNLEEMLRE